MTPQKTKTETKSKEIKNVKEKLRDMKYSIRQPNMHIMGL